MLTFLVCLAGNVIGGFGAMWMDQHYRKKHNLPKDGE